MERLKVERAQFVGGWRFRLTGVLDESLDPRVFEGDLSGCVVFDLDGVQRVTSYGVLRWIASISGLSCDYYCFAGCRPNVVTQFNLVLGFCGRGEIISLYAPYLCPLCGMQVEILLDVDKHLELFAAAAAPPLDCPQCDGAMEFDDFPETYFDYIAQHPRPRPPPAARAILSGEAVPSSNSTSRIVMEVEGNVTAVWLTGDLSDGRRLHRLGGGLEGNVVFVLGGANEIGDSMLETLAQLSSECSAYYARMPIHAASRLLERSDLRGDATIISLMLPSTCEACGHRSRLELACESISLEPPERRCECGGRQRASGRVPQLAKLRVGAAPDSVRAYLSTRTVGPNLRTSVGPEPRNRLGDYELLDLLGKGGMGEVFHARKIGPAGFEKEVVVKRILPQLASSPRSLEMFFREARLAARIDHPNIAQIFDLGTDRGQYFIAMEYVDGWDLSRISSRARELERPWPIELACWVAAEICAGLAAAHEYEDDKGRSIPIIHRDISPANILVSRRGAVKIVDFGVAKISDGAELTESDEVVGKLGYLAPERLSGDVGASDPRVDLFSVAVILFECLTGRHLLLRASHASTINEIVNHQAPRVAKERPSVQPELDALVARALSRDPEGRPSTARDFRSNLEALLTHPADLQKEALALWASSLLDEGR